jgi:hypothetical protein
MIDAVVTLAARPDLTEAMWQMPTTWPPFMLEDPVAEVWFGRLPAVFGEYQLVALDGDGAVVAKVNSVPFAWSGRRRRPAGPRLGRRPGAGVRRAGGRRAADGGLAARGPRRAGPAWRGAQRAAARGGRGEHPPARAARPVRAGAADGEEPGAADADGRVRRAGAGRRPARGPVAAGARAPRRAGGRRLPGLDDGARHARAVAEWSGLPLAESGAVDVPGALVPVHVAVEHDHAVYVEPNVWVHHPVPPA